MDQLLPASISQAETSMHPLHERYQKEFGRLPEVVTQAPGRVEFIGNHTDHNGGSVIGVAIYRSVWVAAAGNPDGHFRVRSTSGCYNVMLPAKPVTNLREPSEWANYVLGVWRAFGDFGLKQPAGFDLLVDSDLPMGAGLSASAALELATAQALLALTSSAPLAKPLDEISRSQRTIRSRYRKR